MEGFQQMPPNSSSAYRPVPGQFGLAESKVRWIGCRETFHRHNANINFYYYCHHANHGYRLAEFIRLLESHLGLVHKTGFKYTQHDTICAVTVASWWLDQPMRHCFFTIALRAAIYWNGHVDLKTGLKQQPYASDTWKAVERFLDGNTFYKGYAVGWHTQFTSPGSESLLVPPKYTDAERHALIERLAYYQWEKAGKPHTDGGEFWRRAEQEYRDQHQHHVKPKSRPITWGNLLRGGGDLWN